VNVSTIGEDYSLYPCKSGLFALGRLLRTKLPSAASVPCKKFFIQMLFGGINIWQFCRDYSPHIRHTRNSIAIFIKSIENLVGSGTTSNRGQWTGVGVEKKEFDSLARFYRTCSIIASEELRLRFHRNPGGSGI
jgi:hypothetical protein